jgi:peptide deformylase
MIYKIITYPNDILRKKSSPIEREEILSADFQKFIDDMIDTMNKQENGAGLAAPQIGIHKRVVIVDDEKNNTKVYINPKIMFKSFTKNILEEGCFSVPGVFGNVKRPKKIWIKYFDRNGKLKREVCGIYSSRVLQHEIDHLDGILFIDKMIKKEK